MTETTTTPGARIERGIQSLVVQSGENSREHGFHDDWPVAKPFRNDESEDQYIVAIRRAIVEKLALVHEEVSEALGEIRSGRDPLEVYFVDRKGLAGTAGLEYEKQEYFGQQPLLKPEGFLVELADAVIRIADLAYLVGDTTGEQLAAALEAKHLYNATRPYKHGRKF